MADIAELIEQLKSAKPAGKRAAFQELVTVGERAMQPLLKAIVNSSAEHVENVLSAIAWEQDGENQKYDDPFSAFSDLVEEDCWFVDAAIHFFEQVDLTDIQPLLALLTEEGIDF